MALLTRARIVDQARSIVEADGHEQLSLRGLAATLDVTAPALYDHAKSKDYLLQAVAACGYEELEAALLMSDAGMDATEQVSRIF